MTKENERNLFKFEHRRRTLKVIEGLLKTFQIIGMVICFMYVILNFLGLNLPDFPIGTKYVQFTFKYGYMNVICFVLSILLAFSRPASLRQQIVTLDLAISYLKSHRGDKISAYKELLIKEAKQYITEVEEKIDKENQNEQIEPHEKRMVFRHYMIIWGIIGISVLTIVLVLLGWNIPQIAAIDLVIGYSMVIIEAYYYQVELKKAGIVTFSKEHKEIITTRDGKKQRYKCCQKICYMKIDRLSNYCLVLSVATTATNIVSILITILDTSGNVDFQRLFALQIKSVNLWVSLIFMIASIVLYIVECVLQEKWDTSILELKAILNMKYSDMNLRDLEERFVTQKQNLFSVAALDSGRGTYDYNNEVLISRYIRDKKVFIPSSCMVTIEDSISARFPRYKLTALISWLCLFCFFVWGKADIKSIFNITVFAIGVFDVMVIVNVSRLCWKHKEWIKLEDRMEKYIKVGCLRGNIKKDVCQRLLIHVIVMIILVLIGRWI